MRLGETTATYVFGLIGLAVVLRYGENVNTIIKGSFSGVSTFASSLLNPMYMPVMLGNTT